MRVERSLKLAFHAPMNCVKQAEQRREFAAAT
jgi:hypothetical protein